MKVFRNNLFTVYTGAFILIAFIFTTSECKSARSKVPQVSTKGDSSDVPTNVFYSVAKSLGTEALSQFKETMRRNPRVGFNITMLLPGLLTNMTNEGFSGGNLLGTTAQLGLIGVKGGILGLKAAIVQAVVLVLFIVFLLTGIAYFACNIGIISCSNVGGSLANLGGGLGGASLGQPLANPFSRAGYDYQHNLHRATSSIYNAIDDGQKKFS